MNKELDKELYPDYKYPEYTQLYGEFNHYITILDVLFNCGKEAPKYIFTGNIEKVQV